MDMLASWVGVEPLRRSRQGSIQRPQGLEWHLIVKLPLLEVLREQQAGLRRGDRRFWLVVSPGCGLMQGHQDVLLRWRLLMLLMMLLLLLLLMGVVACVHHPHAWQGGEERGLPLVDRLEPGREGRHLLLRLRGLQGLEVAHAEGGPADPALVEASGRCGSQDHLQPRGRRRNSPSVWNPLCPVTPRQTERLMNRCLCD